MSLDQTNLTADVHLDLAGDGPVHVRLTHALRTAVRDGRLVRGALLPPSRTLATHLGVSRWVVTQAYGELVAEGVLDARTGSGTRVASDPTGVLVAPAVAPVPALALAPPGRPPYDLAPGVPDLRHVPRADWARATRDALADAARDDLGLADPRGHARLRDALAARLAATRAAQVTADDVVVTHGATDGMARVVRALAGSGHRALLVEDPSWPRLRDVAASAGLTPVPVPVDGQGVDVDALVAAAARTGARAALVTPAHQFPVGAALSPERREALVRWAHTADGVLVEDDYDAEFRYDRRPVAALQGLAPGRTVLLGSVSKTLAPAFGLGWAVLPPRWRDLVGRDGASAPATVHQLAFLRLLGSGAYDRHLRSSRTRYRRRRATLVEALGTRLPDAQVRGIAAGLHVVVTLPAGTSAGQVVEAAAARDVRVADVRRYRVSAGSAPPDGLVVGYGNLADARLEEAVARLAAAVEVVAGAAGAG
ncbi:PLP-dependent aminotransferase family protein [Cellulomonas fimi]|uniref:MocR-like pyridoxine biosynthesis transcription factor PdxR n=1 Tax=Cellulomonas fimi TaxID=1708 RepID=UPI00234DB505|nr:PLP-dependent aminotransferase family protein [Cellulomonas fimi]MDC7119913.1 PLP-dependent aminotransferase family protein [Cellulomonas fimi]